MASVKVPGFYGRIGAVILLSRMDSQRRELVPKDVERLN